jgi:hypothetical protein
MWILVSFIYFNYGFSLLDLQRVEDFFECFWSFH